MKNIKLINTLTVTFFAISFFYFLAVFALFVVSGEFFSQTSKFIISIGGPALAIVVYLMTYQDCKTK